VVDPQIPIWSAVAAGLGTLGVRQFITWLLNRGKVRTDEATAIRIELRAEIQRKDDELGRLRERIQRIEDERDKIENEYHSQQLKFRLYKVDVYRTLIENGASKKTLDDIKLLEV
jgi:predicted nuclease with TOPRIM domain